MPAAVPAEDYAVQVAALRARTTATDLAEKLSANGWLAYVQDFHPDLSTTHVSASAWRTSALTNAATIFGTAGTRPPHGHEKRFDPDVRFGCSTVSLEPVAAP